MDIAAPVRARGGGFHLDGVGLSAYFHATKSGYSQVGPKPAFFVPGRGI
jgi:hypothetical protein